MLGSLCLYPLTVNSQGCKADINLNRTRASPPALIDPDVLLSPLLEDTDDSSISPPVLDPGQLALRRLVSHCTISQDELCSIVRTIVSNMKPADIIKHLKGSDTQRFIDVMDEVCCHDSILEERIRRSSYVHQALGCCDFEPRIRRKCVKSLYMMCAGHTLLPGSLNFELPGNTMGDVRYRGGFADVLRRDGHGKDVAVKVLRAHGLSLKEMKNVSLHKQQPPRARW